MPARHRAMRPGRSHQMTRAQPRQRPQPVGLARDLLHRDPQTKIGSAPPQQEIVQLESPDEESAAGHGAILTLVAHVAVVPFPQAPGVLGRGQRQLVPEGRRHPAAAQLDPRKLLAIDHGHPGTPAGQKARTGAAGWTAPHYDDINDITDGLHGLNLAGAGRAGQCSSEHGTRWA